MTNFHEKFPQPIQFSEYLEFGDERGLIGSLEVSKGLTSTFNLRRILHVHNRLQGTIRGLHGQLAQSAESKFIFCTSGSIFDVYLDLRPYSPTFGKIGNQILDSKHAKGLLLPRGFWHGYQTLEANTDLIYLVDGHYVPKLNVAINPFDSELNVRWPIRLTNISQSDKEALTLAQFLEIHEKNL